MPITPTYKWLESDVAIEVTVQIPGSSRRGADVTLTDWVIKVNAPPFFLLIDLCKQVDETQVSSTFTPDGLVVKLVKVSIMR
jgi:dyslexia susceptibility 1 candidate gene 1 protein